MDWRNCTLFAAVLCLLPCPAAAEDDETPALLGRIAVRVTSDVQLARVSPTGYTVLDSLNLAFGLTSMEPMFLPKRGNDPAYDQLRLGDYYTLYFDSTAPPPESLALCYAGVPQFEIVHIERPYMRAGVYLPCDPLFSDQYYLRNIGQGGADSGMDIGAARAWDVFHGAWDDANNVVVAVVDEGVDVWHGELWTPYGPSWSRDNFAWNDAELNGTSAHDDDSNGFVDDVLGWDFNGRYSPWDSIPGDSGVSALTGHGTAVATIIGAETDTLSGHSGGCSDLIAGVSWYSRVLPIKVLITRNDTIFSWNFDPVSVRRAVQYAADEGVDVLNCSFGYFGINPLAGDSAAYTYAHRKGVAIFAAAGTACLGSPIPGEGKYPMWPAAFDSVFSVGAVDNQGNFKHWTEEDPWCSNPVNQYEQREWLDAMAPGVGIVSGWDPIDTPFTTYVTDFGGTSASAAMASGIAALLKARYPQLSNDDTYHIMRYSARDTVGLSNEDVPGWDRYHGWGLLSADRAINMIMSIVNESPQDGAWVPGQPTFIWRYVPVVNSYHIQIAYDAGFSHLVVSDTNVDYATWEPASDLPETTLYWRVRYNVPSGWQPFTVPTSIRVDNGEPDIPELLSPGAECFYTDSASPGVASFYWSTVESYSPIHYALEYSVDSTFQTGVYGDSSLVDTSWTDNSFAGNHWWYWRVKATDSAGYGSGFQASPGRAVIAALVGDVNANGVITSADIIYLVNYVFKAGPLPMPHLMVGNTNECYGGATPFTVSSSDVITLVNYVFYGGNVPCGLAYPEGCGDD